MSWHFTLKSRHYVAVIERSRGRRSSALRQAGKAHRQECLCYWLCSGEDYTSSGMNCEKASGAASSKRVWRLLKIRRTRSVGPLRCLATSRSA